MRVSCRHWSVKIGAVFFIQERRTKMEKIRIEVDKVILYYMDRVDPDGNLYRFYVYKGMASEIEYFCTEEAGNMTIPIGEGKYIEIMPKEIEKIPEGDIGSLLEYGIVKHVTGRDGIGFLIISNTSRPYVILKKRDMVKMGTQDTKYHYLTTL